MNNEELIDQRVEVKCANCQFFEHRTKFCRKHPPTAMTTSHNGESYFTSTFPKIQMPELDYCFEFQTAKDE